MCYVIHRRFRTALQQSGSSSSSGGGVVFSLDVSWLFFSTFVRNMVIGSWLRCFFIVMKRVLYVDMDESIAFESCGERTM